MTRPAAPYSRNDQAPTMPCFLAILPVAFQPGSASKSVVMRSWPWCTAEPQVRPSAPTSTKSRHNFKISGRLGACARLNDRPAASSCMTAALKLGSIFSTKRQMARSVRSYGVLAAIISSTLFWACASASLRLRSSMSVMLTRIRRFSFDGSRLKRTSQGIRRPEESLCSHSKVGWSPASAASTYPRRTPKDGEPSGCVLGLMASGPTVSSRARDRLNSEQALSLASMKRFSSTSNTMMASGAYSTRAR